MISLVCEIQKQISLIEKESRMVIIRPRTVGGREMGKGCSMNTKLQLDKSKKP
jgi:hypothetical protein